MYIDSYISGDVRDEEVLPMVQELIERLSVTSGSVRSPNSSVGDYGGDLDDADSVRSDDTLRPSSAATCSNVEVVETMVVNEASNQHQIIVDAEGNPCILLNGVITPIVQLPATAAEVSLIETTLGSAQPFTYAPLTSISDSEDSIAKRSRVTSGYSDAPSTPDSGFNTDATKSIVDGSTPYRLLDALQVNDGSATMESQPTTDMACERSLGHVVGEGSGLPDYLAKFVDELSNGDPSLSPVSSHLNCH